MKNQDEAGTLIPGHKQPSQHQIYRGTMHDGHAGIFSKQLHFSFNVQ